jgi:hypothetical protein
MILVVVYYFISLYYHSICMYLNLTRVDVLGWKIGRVVEEAKRLRIAEDQITKLQDEEISGRTLILLIKYGTLETILSEHAAKAQTSIILFPPGNTRSLTHFLRILLTTFN